MSAPERLRAAGIPFALVGAYALAAHGILRATQDIDLLVADRRALDPALWPDGDVRVGDGRIEGQGDPLSGLVRLPGTLDVVVIARTWAAAMISRAEASPVRVTVAGAPVPVLEAADLVLLKLYAGAPQDLRDAESLLADPDVRRVAAERLAASPRPCRAAWKLLRA